jgi:hypothetical protein
MPPIFSPPPLNRIQPQGGPELYKSYSWARPLRTHWREATCEEVQCDDFVNGFMFTCDISTPLGQRQYDFLTHDRERSYTVDEEGPYIRHFIYPPGTRGFAGNKHDHRLPIGREPLLLVRAGDWRKYLAPAYQHASVDDWVEDFATNQDKIQEIQKRG